MLRRCAALRARAQPARLKEALGRLFLRIHPDLHWAEPARMRANEAALQDLNAILAWDMQLRKGELSPAPDTRHVAFYDRHQPAADAAAGAPAMEQKATPPAGDGAISSKLDLPADFSPTAAEVPRATQAVNHFLRSLLERAGVLSEQDRASLDALQRDIDARVDKMLKKAEAVGEEAKEQRERAAEATEVNISDAARDYSKEQWRRDRKRARLRLRTDPMGDFGAAFDAQDMEVPPGAHEEAEGRDRVADATTVKVPGALAKERRAKEKAARRRARKGDGEGPSGHLVDEFDKLMKEHWHPATVPEVTELIAADLIHYDKEISPVDCAAAVDTLRSELSSLRYDRWYFVPLFITTRWGVGDDIPGFISVPYDFDTVSFLRFLDDHDAGVRELQDAAFAAAKGLEREIARARDAVPLGDVVIRCAHPEAPPALELLASPSGVTILRDAEWQDLIVEVLPAGSQYGARDTGVLQIPASADEAELREFCEYLKDTGQLSEVRQAYEQTVGQLEELDKLTRVCTEVIAPNSFDMESGGGSLTEKLQWIREMYSISGVLSKYDWSEYTFVLGPLELDWDEGMLALPPDFHGPNFAETVKMLHEEDMAAVSEREPSSKEEMLLELEARRIKSELQSSGLLELDPEKQTESQKRLLQMIETYSDPTELGDFVREQFPHHVEGLEEQAAVQQELMHQMRTDQGGYIARRLRHYYKYQKRPRAGPNRFQWEYF